MLLETPVEGGTGLTQDMIKKWSSHHSTRLLVSLQYTRRAMNTRARPTQAHDVATRVGPRSSCGSAANSSGVRAGKPFSGGRTSIMIPNLGGDKVLMPNPPVTLSLRKNIDR